MKEYVKPEFKKDAFTCLHCGVFAKMEWINLCSNRYIQVATNVIGDDTETIGNHIFFASLCPNCDQETIWMFEKLKNSQIIYPKQIPIPPAEDMPEHIKKTYKEASLVLGDSPRASCALLRLALQELIKHLKENVGEYSGLKIGNLKEEIEGVIEIGNFNKAQEEMLKKAMHSMRLVANKAVHPSELDLDDNSEIADILFVILNFIVEEVITKPAKMKEDLEKLSQVIKKSKNNQSK